MLVDSECSGGIFFFATQMNNYNLLKNSLEKIEHKKICCHANDQIELITNDFSVVFRKNENTDSFLVPIIVAIGIIIYVIIDERAENRNRGRLREATKKIMRTFTDTAPTDATLYSPATSVQTSKNRY